MQQTDVAPSTPNLDRIQDLRERMTAVREFLEWMESEEGYQVTARYHHAGLNEPGDECFGREDCSHRGESWHIPRQLPAPVSSHQLIMKFFEVDEGAAEREQRDLLRFVRSRNASEQTSGE